MSVKRTSQRLSKNVAGICSSNVLEAGGLGVRFEVTDDYKTWPAFVIRHSQGVAGYINRCAHLALELDWDRGNFFDVDQRHLICTTHGALYTASAGECISGPCNGSGLEALEVVEEKGTVYLRDSRYTVFCRQSKPADDLC